MTPSFSNALDAFVYHAQKTIDEYYGSSFPALTCPKLSIEEGKRYIRLVKFDGVSRSAYCFVDMTNGDILKAASWKAPAKHARGNIYNLVGNEVDSHGAMYLR